MPHPDGEHLRALADAMPLDVPPAPNDTDVDAESPEKKPVRPSRWDALAGRSPRQESASPEPKQGRGWNATARRGSSDEWEAAAERVDDDEFSPPIGAWHDDADEEVEDAEDIDPVDEPESAEVAYVAPEVFPAEPLTARAAIETVFKRLQANRSEPSALEEDDEVDDDYDIFEARRPIRSNRDAWLAVAWVLAFTALMAWATHLFLDSPDRTTVQGGRTQLNDIRAEGTIAPSDGVPGNDGVRRIKVSVIQPDLLGGRLRSSEVQPAAPYYLSQYTDGEIVSGAYGELAQHNYVLMSAVTSAHFAYPDTQLGSLLDDLQDDDPNLVDPQPVPAGTLAGVARCGESKNGDQPKVVCFWADAQCLGVITWFDQPTGQALAEFLTLREQIEHLA